MKKLSLILCFALVLSLLAGCAGTPVVYYSDCTCPTGSHTETVPQDTTGELPTEPQPTSAPADSGLAEGELLTALWVETKLTDSVSATAEADGKAVFDVTVAAVLFDADYVVRDCVIDSVSASVTFDAAGNITSDVNAGVLSKRELGDDYGMKAYAGAQYEWYEQVDALEAHAVGQTVEGLMYGSLDDNGYASDVDLATTATIHLGSYVQAMWDASGNAHALGAQSGDELKLAIIPSLSDSTSADAENAGNAQLNVDVAVVTMNGDVISSCYIDSVQAKVAFDANGAITSDLTAPVQTKNQLGENYGMVAWGGAIAEWNEQAASFAAYVTGKTAQEVAGIAVSEGKAAEADLAASVTIAIGGFQALIAKACG